MPRNVKGVHIFRVSITDPIRRPTADQSGPKVFYTRKSHRKSRNGCKACKLRRRRCDEGQPKCSYCVAKDLSCDYLPNPTSARLGNTATAADPAQHNLWPGDYTPVVLTHDQSEVRHTQYDMYLLHHFIQSAVHGFQSPEVSQCYSDKVLNLAMQYPFLMHAMIAVSSCHLQHMGIDARKYRTAEALHCHYASQGLRKSILVVNGLRDSDAVLTTSMLLNTLTFCAASYRDEAPFDSPNNGGPRWDWLRIQIGLTGLLMKTSPFHPESIWQFLFAASNHFEFSEPPSNTLDQQLSDFCGIDEGSNEDNNVYFEPLRFLSPLITREPAIRYMALYLRVVGTITSSFIDLLEENETRALLLFAHWLALMCSIEQWWCVRRTRRECWAICDILSKRLDPSSINLLEPPARACGYPFNVENEVDEVPSMEQPSATAITYEIQAADW